MAQDGAHENSGMRDLEKELTCSICTDVIYQPLTLLDCLHSFCGSCLREWFSWQAASAAQNRRTSHPYTCPSCRESVRSTKADWRITTLLEGYLKANPDRSKSEEEKEEIAKHYKPGDNVLVTVRHAPEEGDSEDERLLAQARELSMADVDPETARRRAERTARHRRRQNDGEEHGRRQPSSLTESRMREHNAGQPHIEHQPSLRSLLSTSDADPQDVQTEILRSIYAEGLLDGIDIDNLSPEQEEELTERIAEAYRRRQRRRDRSRNREARSAERPPRRPPSSGTTVTTSPPTQRFQNENVSSQTHQSHSRPTISRPHLFETTQDSTRGQQRPPHSRQQSSHSTSRAEGSDATSPATRSATDPVQRASAAENDSRLPPSNGGRSFTDVDGGPVREQDRNVPALPGNAAYEIHNSRPHRSSNHLPGSTRHQTMSSNHSSVSLSDPMPSNPTVRPAVSTSAFAPEPVSNKNESPAVPVIRCNRCEKPDIQYDIHYNCSSCLDGAFNLCQRCYRLGHGCYHWFGFGYRAFERWQRSVSQGGPHAIHERPHILTPRRYTKIQDQSPAQIGSQQAGPPRLDEGAFCEGCSAFCNDYYWYCSICLDGAWGFCDPCVKQGKHCTHHLLPVGHQSAQVQPHQDLTKATFVPLPHMKPDSFVAMPVPTFCDICHRSIPPNHSRFHCYQCSAGDYDICNECYHGLVAQGKISQANGPSGWRRCLHGHRMAVVGYQDTAEGGHLRTSLREPVGGLAFKEDGISLSSQIPQSGLPPDGGVGLRCLAVYSYFPPEGVKDELAFPKNAEIREVGKLHEEWYWGVYAGNVNLFPSNHVRVL